MIYPLQEFVTTRGIKQDVVLSIVLLITLIVFEAKTGYQNF